MTRRLEIVATICGFAYFAWAAWLNLALALPPLKYDGDHAQAVAHYWRYHVDGAMPPGDLLTDYAFLMHAPIGWWLPMAALSMVVTPLAAAKLLSVVAYAATAGLAWFIVRRAGGPWLAATALVLLARASPCHYFLAGGYARSFGPPLVFLFIAAWLHWGHRAVLAVLVLQAALYPSVVIPCGLTYGVWCVLAGPMPARVRRCASLAAAGVVIIGLGLMQDVRAPREWGSVVWLSDALEMPAWGRGGRINEAPLQPISVEVARNLVRPFQTHGHVPVRLPFGAMQQWTAFVAAWTLLALVVAGRRLWLFFRVVERENCAAEASAVKCAVPWQLPALFFGAFAGYLLSRALAFKLYLPYRVLAHSWVWIMALAMPLIAYELGLWIFRGHRARAVAFGVALSLAPTIVFLGDGLAPHGDIYGNDGSERAKLHAWIRKNTKLDAVFAGDLKTLDRVPLFTYRRVLVNKALAHPFRPGFYALVDERIRAMYAALYARDLEAVVAFADAWHVDHIVLHTDVFQKLDPRVFAPIRADVAETFRANRGRFALQKPPRSAIAFSDGKLRVIDVDALRRALATGEAAPEALPVEGQRTEDARAADESDDDPGAPDEGERGDDG